MLIKQTKELLNKITIAQNSHDGLVIKFANILSSAIKYKNINEVSEDTKWSEEMIQSVLNKYRKDGIEILTPRPKKKKAFFKNKFITTFEGAEWTYYKGALLISSMKNTEVIMNTIDSLFPNLKDKDILDIGSGEGAQAMILRDKGANIQCVDIESTRYIPQDIPFLKMDVNDGLIEKLPNKKYDLVICIETLGYLNEPFKFFKEAYSLLNEGGHLIITMNNITNFVSRAYFITEGTFYNMPKKELTNGSPSPFTTLPWFTYERMFKISGFKNITTKETDPMSIVSLDTLKSTMHSLLRIVIYILSLKSLKDPRVGKQVLIKGEK